MTIAVAITGALDACLVYQNRLALANKQSWIAAGRLGGRVWMAHFSARGQPCWECFAHILRRNIGSASVSGPRSAPGPLRGNAVSKMLALLPEGMLLTYTNDYTHPTQHVIRARAQCVACGDPKGVLATATLNASALLKNTVGSHQQKPTTLCANLSSYVHPITGIVSRICDITDKDSPFYTSVALRNPRRTPVGTISWGATAPYAFGTGRTRVTARVAAVCEAIERYSGVYEGYESVLTASFQEVEHTAVHPNELMLFSATQFNDRVPQDDASSWRHAPMLLPPDQPINWTVATSLSLGRKVLLPSASCFYNMQEANDTSYCIVDSNGCAAGQTLADAILKGFLETVERDAAGIWWYNAVNKPPTRLKGFRLLDHISRYFETLERPFYLYDITSDFGIPVFAAVSITPGDREQDLGLGFGCDPNYKIAAAKALSELCRRYSTSQRARYTSRDQLVPLNLDFLYPAKGEGVGEASHESLRFRSVEDVVTMTTEKGLEFIVLNQSRPDMPLKVVRVLIPGLRSFYPRFAPGRLYDVPVKLGWLKSSKSECSMNSVALMP